MKHRLSFLFSLLLLIVMLGGCQQAADERQTPEYVTEQLQATIADEDSLSLVYVFDETLRIVIKPTEELLSLLRLDEWTTYEVEEEQYTDQQFIRFLLTATDTDCIYVEIGDLYGAIAVEKDVASPYEGEEDVTVAETVLYRQYFLLPQSTEREMALNIHNYAVEHLEAEGVQIPDERQTPEYVAQQLQAAIADDDQLFMLVTPSVTEGDVIKPVTEEWLSLLRLNEWTACEVEEDQYTDQMFYRFLLTVTDTDCIYVEIGDLYGAIAVGKHVTYPYEGKKDVTMTKTLLYRQYFLLPQSAEQEMALNIHDYAEAHLERD